jgi:hypothetical protein
MIRLPTVTLLLADCFRHEANIHAIEECLKHCEFGAVKYLTNIKTNSPHKIDIPYIASGKEYDDFCFNHLWSYCDTEFMLLIQCDGFIVNPNAWHKEYLLYDWIGAPWWYSERNVGNGGFSIRSRRLMEYIAMHPKALELCTNEDDEICRQRYDELVGQGFTFAPEFIAHLFSWEGNGKYPNYDNHFGFHGKGNQWYK